MPVFNGCFFGGILICCTWCFAENSDSDEMVAAGVKPGVEVGGNVSLIYESPFNDMERTALRIGEVEFGATTTISREVSAAVLFKAGSNLDSIGIDQALVSYKPGIFPMEILFGQQAFNHGLLSTRLISDPLILNSVTNMEIKAPGAIINGTFEHFSGGLGFTIFNKDTFNNEVLKVVPSRIYSGVVNVDIPLPNRSMVRLSSLIYKKYMDIDLAGSGNWKMLTFDAEGVRIMNTTEAEKQSGVYAGIRWAANNFFALALRGDAISRNDFSTMEKRVAGGASVAIKDGIFAALEFSQTTTVENYSYQKIAFEVGLKQTLSLPGFQRKTLIRE